MIDFRRSRTSSYFAIQCVVALMIPVGLASFAAETDSSTPPAQVHAFQQHAMTHPGDAKRGKTLFADEKRTRCLICHQVDGAGGSVGPDLSKIGGKFDRIHLIESLLEPSAQIVQGYETSVMLMTDGSVRTGVVTKENKSQLRLEDSQGKAWDLALNEIESRRIHSISTMPTNLVKDLTSSEFTDLIAYLETLRSGLKNRFGSGTRGPILVPQGHVIETLVTGLSGATALEVLSDGRVLVCEQEGRVRVIKDGVLLPRPMLNLEVEHNWERGLIGLTVDPKFPQENWVYVCYVKRQPYSHHCISRFRVNGDVADPGSEQVLLEGDDQSRFGGNVPAGHQGGALHFGTDGCLYVGLGEQTAKTPSQDMAALQGKILRIHADGSIPSDNPFRSETSGKYQAIWAIGCRNPFTFAVDRASGRILINDVGGGFEEINPGVAGANYGWPTTDHGPTTDRTIVGPIHHYKEASISGGDFGPATASAPFANRYVFADFVHGWIRTIDPISGGKAETVVTGLRRPVDLRFSRDGVLYVLLRNAWVVDDKFQRDSGSLVKIRSE